jgi:hypothetical protein
MMASSRALLVASVLLTSTTKVSEGFRTRLKRLVIASMMLACSSWGDISAQNKGGKHMSKTEKVKETGPEPGVFGKRTK